MTGRRDTGRWAALIVNPAKADPHKLTAVVATASTANDWAKPRVYETTVGDPGQAITRQAIADGASALFVAGGDGTVRAASEAAANSGLPFGILPSGTGNLLARNLELPLDDPQAIANALFADELDDLDVAWARFGRVNGEIEEHAFVVLGGIGADAAMIANTSSTLKKQVGWVAYLEGAARAISSVHPFRLVFHVEGRALRNARAHSVLFANCGVLPAGIELLPDASISDGELDIAVVQPRGAFGWIKVWHTVWWENSVLRRIRRKYRNASPRRRTKSGRESIEFFSGRWVEIAPLLPQPIQLDGDEFGEATWVHCHVDPAALRVAVPR